MGNVSVVIVSHSRRLAEGIVELLQPLTNGLVHIAHAAGMGGELGTDVHAVVETLQVCPGDSGIVVLFDLGSALLSCEMALELVDEEVKTRTAILDAPLVEGAITAAVESSLGSPLETIVRNSEKAARVRKIFDSSESGGRRAQWPT